MALPTLYKARGVPAKQPVCAICADRTRGRTVSLRLTHRITVWLCAAHASPEFQCRRNGRDFVVTLQRLWQAHGCLTAARARRSRRTSTPWPDRPGPPARLVRVAAICGGWRRPSSRSAARRSRRSRACAACARTARPRLRASARCSAGTARAAGCARPYPPLMAEMTSTRESGRERGLEPRPLPIDVHVDVPAQRRARLAQAVADSGPALVEPVDGLVSPSSPRRRAGAAGRRIPSAA